MKGGLALASGIAIGLGAAAAFVNRGKIVGMFHGAGVNPAASLTENAADVAVRQIRRFSFAASQDLSPVVGLTHANYAFALLEALEEAIGRERLKSLTSTDPVALKQFIVALQDRHAKALEGRDPFLQRVLEMERQSGGSLPGINMADGFGPAPHGG